MILAVVAFISGLVVAIFYIIFFATGRNAASSQNQELPRVQDGSYAPFLLDYTHIIYLSDI